MRIKEKYQTPEVEVCVVTIERIVCVSDPDSGGSEMPNPPIVIPS